jgi:hypothetical protein
MSKYLPGLRNTMPLFMGNKTTYYQLEINKAIFKYKDIFTLSIIKTFLSVYALFCQFFFEHFKRKIAVVQ